MFVKILTIHDAVKTCLLLLATVGLFTHEAGSSRAIVLM